MLKDSLNLLNKLTFKKVFNAALVYSSFYKAKYTKKIHHKGLPISLSYEPTTSCNLRCPECPSGLRSFTRPTGMLENTTFFKTIDELKETLIYLTLYFQGEPYLNKNLFEMIRYASSEGIYVNTSTNGHYLNDENAKRTVESGLDRLIISIDGTSQDTYESYRIGGNLEKVLEGTSNIIKWKKELKSATPHVVFQFLVVKPNEHQIEEVKELGKKYGVDEVKFKTAQIYDYEDGSDLIPSNLKYSRYIPTTNGKWKLKNKLDNECWRLWASCVITWDQKIVPCCFDKDAQFIIGNHKDSSFKAIWRSEKYNSFRKKVFTDRSQIEICKNCTEGTEVWVDASI
ncbi:radical SAM/SPASM domain-containing protein [Sediminitomix flava]|uniref:Radical SAM protein with 4Fe4S-binding SPASM domain n=1 Tax=Sediminitomix flava TaxID=379075 RepID=A0A315Z5N4_SEDFL|nr:radical SAM/SPASM domain-containing protein [Sediminitomix flava]PWJ38587.1 radical SAM protein with 4Fe4S-binding SPASM domain [Sediminitomix flava]